MAWTTPGTATAGEVLTAAFWNTQVRDNMVELAPFSAAWTSWTPTLTNLTVGAGGTRTSLYLKVGRMVAVYFNFTYGSGSAVSGDVKISLPFTNARNYVTFPGIMDVAGSGYQGFGLLFGGDLYVRTWNSAGTYPTQQFLSATIPATWATGNQMTVTGIYEAQS